jgi:hypothetical protein
MQKNNDVSDNIHEAFESLMPKKEIKSMSKFRLEKADFELLVTAVNTSKDQKQFVRQLDMIIRAFEGRTAYRYFELQAFGMLIWEMVCCGFEIKPRIERKCDFWKSGEKNTDEK